MMRAGRWTIVALALGLTAILGGPAAADDGGGGASPDGVSKQEGGLEQLDGSVIKPDGGHWG